METEEANPVMVFGVAFAGIVCLRSKKAVVLAAIATAARIVTESMAMVKVPEEAEVFATAMLVTIVVVLVLGTVYKVAEDVAAAARVNTFAVTAIIVTLP